MAVWFPPARNVGCDAAKGGSQRTKIRKVRVGVESRGDAGIVFYADRNLSETQPTNRYRLHTNVACGPDARTTHNTDATHFDRGFHQSLPVQVQFLAMALWGGNEQPMRPSLLCALLVELELLTDHSYN